MNLVRVSKVKSTAIPVAASTLYKWWHTKTYPQLFIKLQKALYIDVTEFEKLIEEKRYKPKDK